MKVAYFCDTYEPQVNGVSRTLKKLRQYAKSNDIETIFLVPSYPGREETEDNVYRFLSLPLLFYRDCRVAVPPMFKAEQILDRFEPDIIHAYSEFTISLAAIRYAQKRGVPIVSSYTTNFTTYLSYYNLDFLSPYLDFYLNWFHNSCRFTYCPSAHTREYLINKNIKRAGIMKRGVDSEQFNPSYRSQAFRRSAGAGGGSVVFTYVGRISPEKDLDILAQSIKRTKAEYGDRAVFVVVGDGPYLSRLKSELAGLAFFTGFLKGKALSEAYASSDVFVFPSTSETFGNVVLEAMSSGLPAIVPNRGGAAEIVTDELDGFVVAPRDTDAFAGAVSKFLKYPGLAAEMGGRAAESSKSWSWQSVFSGLFESYRMLLEEKQDPVGASLGAV